MKQYVIDGLRPNDHKKLKQILDSRFGPAALGIIYWVEIEKSLLSPTQKDHQDCSPHWFTLELESDRLSCELLVRIKKNIRCDCMGYATPQQREWLMDTIDAMLDELKIEI